MVFGFDHFEVVKEGAVPGTRRNKQNNYPEMIGLISEIGRGFCYCDIDFILILLS